MQDDVLHPGHQLGRQRVDRVTGVRAVAAPVQSSVSAANVLNLPCGAVILAEE
ncbi:hypothetical protein [Amycolatopsis sp. lyj-23]|uniref:hypothetical protein n=1 Tax=Amycolatopsis sp. lyj-23 TaxID=2789283 RepID=UPI00397AA1D4